ncbi:MAG TPA: FAD-dependent monooxygenase [Stellaceae bacterium]|nr:FAD-dependent monooxygenase [Stellaceae bacterium]
MTGRRHVLIAGAGIGGLTAALALLRQGVDVDVYEQAAELQELGAGLQISANGSRVLQALGLGAAVRAVACIPTGKEIRLWNTGQTWKLFDLGAVSEQRYGAPYLMIHRGDLHGILRRAVEREKPGAIHPGMRCVGVMQTGGEARLAFANGATAGADAVIGADGVHSQIRQALFGESRAEFTGIMAWRGLVPMRDLPARIARPVGTNWVGPGGHVVHYPLRRGEVLNFVGIVERDDWRVESWTERGTKSECAADFRFWHDDIQEIVGHIDVPFKWALLGREPLARWSVGRVTLLGDACHPTLPFLAQGANMAIEDGFVLARVLTAYQDVEAALCAYEAARRERTARIVRGSAENAARFHNKTLSTPNAAERYIDAEWREDRVKERYDWLFDYDATAVAI